MYDNIFLCICILCILFVFLFFGHLCVMHVLKVSLHNCRNYEFLVIKEIITLTLDSVCIQATGSVDIVDRVFCFFSCRLFIQVNLSSRFCLIFLQQRKHSCDGDRREIAVLGVDSKALLLVGTGPFLSESKA